MLVRALLASGSVVGRYDPLDWIPQRDDYILNAAQHLRPHRVHVHLRKIRGRSWPVADPPQRFYPFMLPAAGLGSWSGLRALQAGMWEGEVVAGLGVPACCTSALHPAEGIVPSQLDQLCILLERFLQVIAWRRVAGGRVSSRVLPEVATEVEVMKENTCTVAPQLLPMCTKSTRGGTPVRKASPLIWASGSSPASGKSLTALRH